jgi:hypothetical protein
VERLVEVLRRDPDLAWAVAQRARVLGPWERVGDDWWQRQDSTEFSVVTVREERGEWLWSVFVRVAESPEEEVANGRGHPTPEAAMAACDVWMTGDGWLLATKPA